MGKHVAKYLFFPLAREVAGEGEHGGAGGGSGAGGGGGGDGGTRCGVVRGG